MKIAEELPVRPPSVAGSFYPADGEVLSRQIGGFFSQGESPPEPLGLERLPAILIVPHAGYEYSGPVAAAGFKQLVNSEIERVILLGVSHRAHFKGAAVFEKGFWRTPLGKVRIDVNLAQEIVVGSQLIFANEEYHRNEHSLEVELPFLQKVLKEPKIVPILIGEENESLIENLSSFLAKNLDSQTILIISSDFSHYPPYEDANKVDKKTIGAILSGKVENLEKIISESMRAGITNLATCACGETAIKVGMETARKLGIKDVRLIKYANSGDVPIGEKSQVVGYAVIGFYSKSSKLNKKQQEKLLEIARETLGSCLKTGKIPEFEVDEPELNKHLGAFVTLRKNDQLRGCIGKFEPKVSLWQVVQRMAIEAAINDPRFPPVSFEELKEIKIEISVLSPRQKINDRREIELGKHGVVVKKGLRSGVFLPQVATESNWDLDTFMGHLCSQKAGLEWDCWKQKDVELYTFTAQVFEES